jgi:Tectonin domain
MKSKETDRQALLRKRANSAILRTGSWIAGAQEIRIRSSASPDTTHIQVCFKRIAFRNFTLGTSLSDTSFREENMNRRILLLIASIVCWAGVIGSAWAQEFDGVPGLLTQVAAGRAEVWGLDASQKVYRYNPAGKKFAKLAGKITLSQIAVGGGTLLQADEVWGVSAGTQIYHYDFTTKKLVEVQGNLVQIVVGEGNTDGCHPYEVWGINSSDLVFRYDYCAGEFDQIQGTLTRIATGSGEVWGLNSSAQIFDFNFKTQQWTKIGGSLQQIVVGVNDVWGLDGSGKLYRFNPASGFSPFGTAVFTQIAAGGDGVWGINSSAETIMRFVPNAGNEVTITGVLSQISVGYGAGVWGVNSADEVFAFERP